MNVHKKLLDLGFTRCEHYKTESNLAKVKIIPDKFNKVTHYAKGESKNEVAKVIETLKIHPKNKKSYNFKTEDVTIWMKVVDDVIINIFIEENGWATEIYNNFPRYERLKAPPKNLKIESKMDIIKLFPKDFQRDIIINQILK